MSIEKNLETCVADMNAKLEAAKAAFSSKDLDAYAVAKAELETAVNECNIMVQKNLYDDFAKQEKPFAAFATAFTYEGFRAKETKDKETQLVTGIEIEKVNRRLSLRGFIKEKSLDNTILTDISKLLTLLVVRENNIMQLSHEDFAKKSPFFCKVVSEKSKGGTPDSNTQICKAIQGVMEKCGIECRVINPDMHFIQQCAFVHDARGKCRVKPVTDGKFQTIMVDVMNHFVAGTSYSVLEKKQQENQ